MKKALLIFLALVLFDALLGGLIAAFLQRGGWTPGDQQVNDLYQLFYGVIIGGTLVGTRIFHAVPWRGTIGMLILLFGYVEDTLFYILVHSTNPLTKLMLGATYKTPGGGLFPEAISGYLGWLGRHVFNVKISLEMWQVLIFNAVAIAIFIALWLIERRQKPLKNDFMAQ